MTDFLLPLILAAAGVITVFYTYSSIRKGGARVYTLERETILRRAISTLFASMGLFLAAIGLLIYQAQPPAAGELLEESGLEATQDAAAGANTPAPQGTSDTIPPLTTLTPSPTIDLTIPTATPSPVIVRAFVTGTGGNGLQLREAPGGEPIEVLPEDTFVTVIEAEGTLEQGGFTWIKVRTFTGEEGWVADAFIEIEGGRP